MSETRIHSAPPYPLFESGALNPGNLLYCPPESVLEVQFFPTVASAEVRLRGLMLRPDGTREEFVLDVDATLTGDYNSGSLSVGEGFLVLCSVADYSGTAAFGNTWVRVMLMLYDTDGGHRRITLAEGPIAQSRLLPVLPQADFVLPGANINRSVITGADPAAGAEISVTVPTTERYRLHALRATLVTAAAAATRQVHLQITDGTNVLLDIPANATEIISLTRVYNFAHFGTAPAATDAQIYGNLPADLWLRPDWKIQTLTTALDVGDNWSAPILTADVFPDY